MIDPEDHDDGFDSFSLHLPYDCFVDHGVLLLDDDNAVLAVIEYRGRDQSGMTEAEIMAVRNAVAGLLQPFGDGWTFHFEMQRRRITGYPDSVGVHPVPELLDARRRAFFQRPDAQFESRCYLSVRYTPPPAAGPWLQRVLLEHPPDRAIKDADRDLVQPFRAVVVALAGHLQRVLGQARLLDDDGVLTFLHNCVSPIQAERLRACRLPGWEVNKALADTGLVPGAFPLWTNGGAAWHLRVLGLLGFPDCSRPHILNRLDDLPFEFRFVVRFEALSRLTARGVLAKRWRDYDDTAYDLRALLLRVFDRWSAVPRDAVGLLEAMDAEAARVEAEAPGCSSGWLTATFVVWGETLEHAAAREADLSKVLTADGFTVVREGLGAVPAWEGTLPGNVRSNPRKALFTQVHLADLAILTAHWRGPSWNAHLGCGPLLQLDGAGRTPLAVDLFAGQDGAALLVGPPGEGKSTLQAVLGQQWLARVPRGRVVWIDVDAALSTSLVATWMAGGEVLSFGAGDLALQPLAAIDTPDGMAWAHGFLMDLFAFQGVLDRDGLSRAFAAELLSEALTALAARLAAERRITHLRYTLQKDALRGALEPFCTGQPYGDLLDAAHDRLHDVPWTTVDIGALLARGAVADLVLRALFRRFYELFQDGRPTLFMVDEGYRMLTERPTELEEIRRRGRKHNVALMLSTHRLEDVARAPAAAMLKTIQTLICLRDVTARSAEVYAAFGLNRTQRQTVAGLLQHQELFVKTVDGNRVGRLALDPVTLAICGCGMAAMRDQARALFDRHGPAGFPAAWLRARGFAAEAALLAEAPDARVA